MTEENVLKVVGNEEIVGDTGAHADIRRRVIELKSQVEDSYWELSKIMHGIYHESLYIDWGYKNWKEYVAGELDFGDRKATYLVNIQDWFGKMHPSVQSWVKDIGWSKSKELVGRVNNDNAAEWKSRIEGLSVSGIVALIRELNKEVDDDGSEESDSSITVEKTAKKTFALFPLQMENVDNALEAASELAESDKDGHLLDLICTSFLAQNAGVKSTAEYLADVERSIGVKLIAYDKDADTIVYGNDTLDGIYAEDEESE